MRKKISIEELKQLSPALDIIKEFPWDPSKKISYFLVKCPQCGKEIKVDMQSLKELKWRSCRECYLKVKGEIKSKNAGNKFIKQASILYKNKYDYSKVKYRKADEKVTILCPEHGEFLIRPAKHLRGHGCPKCGNEQSTLKRSLTKEQFVERAKQIHGDKYDYSEFNYTNDKAKSIIICPIHGRFIQQASVHIRMKSGCPKCIESKGEEKIRVYLESHNIRYVSQYRFKDCKDKNPLPFDFYLPDCNMCIEFDGEQHFKAKEYFGGKEEFRNIKRRDKIKNKYCEMNNVNLIRIKYTKINEIDKILEDIF